MLEWLLEHVLAREALKVHSRGVGAECLPVCLINCALLSVPARLGPNQHQVRHAYRGVVPLLRQEFTARCEFGGAPPSHEGFCSGMTGRPSRQSSFLHLEITALR